ncbi:MAG: CvpA family protein [Alphaproteobacteria bacterium]|nr:CvpA family protein [Alphaproteobacteria bacterium]
MEQTDLILLIVIGLSVLVGLNRGFANEILRLAVYIFSGVLGYSFAPVLQPAFSFIPHAPTQKALAVLLGTFLAWLTLKIFTSSLVQGVKNSRFKKLDRSLGGVFGFARAGVLLILLCFGFGFFAPHVIRSSRILTLSHAGISRYVDFPDPKASKEEREETADESSAEQTKTAEEQDWKKSLLHYMQHKTVDTKDGEKKLISSVSAIVGKSVAKDMKQFLPKEQQENISAEEYEKFLARIFETQLTNWLNGKETDESEIQSILQEKITEALKEKAAQK